MLVLSRKQSEEIKISDDITITVVKVGRSRVHLAINAPAGVSIVRSELLDSVEEPEQ
jgi:carbon storage regulator